MISSTPVVTRVRPTSGAGAVEPQSWNDTIIAEFRAHSGVVRWSTREDLDAGRPVPPPLPHVGTGRGAPILLLRHTGPVTGRRRTTPLMYLAVGDGYAVFATFGGSPRPPMWFHDVERDPEVTVEVGTDVLPATARVTDGAERDSVWREQTGLVPTFADFQTRAGRRIPVVVLDVRRDRT